MASHKRDLPSILEPIYFDFHWSQKKLWALPLAPVRMKIAEMTWLLDYPIWASDPPAKLYDLCPREVLLKLDQYPTHALRIEAADTTFPLHVMFWKERWVIMDGFHRLLKAMLAGDLEIAAYQVPVSAIPLIEPDADQPTGFLKYELARRDGLLTKK